MRRKISLPLIAASLLLCLGAAVSASRAGDVQGVQRGRAQATRGESILVQRLFAERLAALSRLAEAAAAEPSQTDTPKFSTNGIYDDPDPAGMTNKRALHAEATNRDERKKRSEHVEEEPVNRVALRVNSEHK